MCVCVCLCVCVGKGCIGLHACCKNSNLLICTSVCLNNYCNICISGMCVFVYVCVNIIHDTHISMNPIFSDGVGPCMLRQSLPIILLTYNAGSKYSTSLCVHVCIHWHHTFMNMDGLGVHTQDRVYEDVYSQHSCQCHWCRTRRVGSTPPASA